MCFTIFQKEKTPLQAIKRRSSKSSKNCFFMKGVRPRPPFWSKNGHFSIFLFQAIQARKMCFRILQKDKTPFQAIKTRSNSDFFQRGQYMVLVRNWPFFHLFILGNIGQKNVFQNILEGKNAFLGYENKKLKKSKNSDFLQRG